MYMHIQVYIYTYTYSFLRDMGKLVEDGDQLMPERHDETERWLMNKIQKKREQNKPKEEGG